MELESETLFASTQDNVEAILNRLLIILSETFDIQCTLIHGDLGGVQ